MAREVARGPGRVTRGSAVRRTSRRGCGNRRALRAWMSSVRTRSSTWCMVVPTRPNSTTGQWRLTKRASDVPPVVESVGRDTAGRLDRARDEVGEGAGRGEEAFARDVDGEVDGDAGVAASGGGLFPEPAGEAVGAVGVVETDVDGGAGARRDDVGCGVAGVDGGDGEGGGVEMAGAGVELVAGEAVEQAAERGQRVPGAVRVGRVALDPGRGDVGGEGAAAADLDGVAHALGAGGFADEAGGHGLAVCLHPVDDRGGAVLAAALLVAGDRDDDGAVGRARCGPCRKRRRQRPRRRISCRQRRGPRASRHATSPPNGSRVQSAESPGGTTSVWPLKPKVRG